MLVIRDSPIEGQGLFTDQDLEAHRCALPIAAVVRGGTRWQHPLSLKVNHTSNPNCQVVGNDGMYRLITIQAVPSDTELTCDYRKLPAVFDSNINFKDKNMTRQYTDAFLYGVIAKCAEYKVDPMKFAESLDRDRELSDYEDYADYCNDNSTGHGKRTCPGCDTTVNCRCPTKALKSDHESHKLLCKTCFDGQVKEAGKGGDYGCAMVYFEDCGNALDLWNQDMALIDIPEEDLHENGREDEPHVTVLYGIHTSDADKVKESLLKADIQGCTFRMGGLGIFENDDFDVLIRHVDEISKLKELRDQLIEDLETTITFPDYKAHATIAYLKKGKGKEYLKKHKDTKWNLDKELESDTVDFSDKGTTHTKIKLQ